MTGFRKPSLQDPEPHDALARPDAMSAHEDRIKPATSTASRRPSTATYSLFPPSSPPPNKALPPIPPLRSPLRPGPTNAFMPTRGPHSPAASRSRASSEVTQDSKFSSLSSAQTRCSASSCSSIPAPPPPPRSSSHSYKPPPPPPAPTKDTTELVEDILPVFDVIPLRRLATKVKDAASGGAYFADTSPSSTILATRHGKFHVRLWDLPSASHVTTLKVSFYVQAQMRSREYFVRSHAILSETRNLIAIAAAFGQSVEIWDWARRKKLQTIHDANRWASTRGDVYETRWPSLAVYREDDDTIQLYPTASSSSSSTAFAKKPFGKPRVIELRRAGLPHMPKLPELAYSATGPLLVAAAGPRPPRPGHPPPEHGALLMAWQLDGDAGSHNSKSNEPYRYYEPRAQHPELDNSLPLVLATYGSVSISIWEAARFRTIGKPGAWQVEPTSVTERVVLVWDFGGAEDKARIFRIPAVLACISPDCRFVAYCDPGTSGSAGALVVLDAIRDGRELWRLDGDDTGVAGLRLAADLKKVTELAFAADGNRLFVGDGDGGVAVFEVREGIGMAV
ncbi:hypothetical protein BD289DRAFT_458650 [Coniella lustricola]|uniref:WD40-repeat-containing domain protein n=1 Tax=Coniella lustricola TaxID=2025994 RepID=A0A2T3AIK9_9PEZI|nr:hypothetical protein BD289DRAFT_458650 [Coniella lustricola]